MARAARSKREKVRPDPPDVPSTREPVPPSPDFDITWDGLLVGPDVEVPEHVADLSLQLSHVSHRANAAQAGDDIDRLYIVIQYPLKLGPF